MGTEMRSLGTTEIKQIDEDITIQTQALPLDSSIQYEVIHKHDRIYLNPVRGRLIAIFLSLTAVL